MIIIIVTVRPHKICITVTPYETEGGKRASPYHRLLSRLFDV